MYSCNLKAVFYKSETKNTYLNESKHLKIV